MTFMTLIKTENRRYNPGTHLTATSKANEFNLKSKDPAAFPRNPKAFLVQESQFADLLSFGGTDKKNLKARVGATGHNPFLDEIEERLRDPEGRAVLLEKSLLTRQDPATQKKQW